MKCFYCNKTLMPYKETTDKMCGDCKQKAIEREANIKAVCTELIVHAIDSKDDEFCVYCNMRMSYDMLFHKPDCIVRIAERLLKEIEE